MALQTKGSFVPLSWGTVTLTGYVVESADEASSTGEHLIEDEIGDTVTQITKFGLKDEVTIEVIPATAIAPPVPGDVFTYDGKKLTILTIAKKRVKKDVQKWTITGNRFPGVSLV